jgi:tetratricopeptide (TPR) repeat protein
MFNNAEGRRVAAEPLDATDAQSLVARADAIMTGDDLASTRAARKLYEQAIERNPGLSAEWIGHLETLDDEHWRDLSAGRDERLLAEIDRDSRRAIQLDDRDPRAWRAREVALADQWQWQGAFEANDRARALDPSRFWSRAALYILSERSAEALEEIAKRNAMVGLPDFSQFTVRVVTGRSRLAYYAYAPRLTHMPHPPRQ